MNPQPGHNGAPHHGSRSCHSPDSSHPGLHSTAAGTRRPKRGYVSRLLLCCACFLLVIFALPGCVQFVPPTPELEQNYPPHILDIGIDPPQLEVIIPRTQEPRGVTVFKVTRVIDLNRQDTLYAYWFLGYQQFPRNSFRCVDDVPPLTSTDGDIDNFTREFEFICRISHGDVLLRKNEVVSLELFIVDRQADITALANGVRKWPEGSHWHRWVWNLKTE